MKAYRSPCFQTDPLGLARFLKQKVSETKTTINETKTSEFKDGERLMLTEIGGASQPSEEEADSQGDRSAHGRFIQEADCNASQLLKGAVDEEVSLATLRRCRHVRGHLGHPWRHAALESYAAAAGACARINMRLFRLGRQCRHNMRKRTRTVSQRSCMTGGDLSACVG